MFSRIAIVNRGEAAMRLIHAVRDLNASAPDGPHIQVVALHTDGERSAMFVREADIAYNLGPASERPYLNYATLERALLDTGADAAWVGWGFVAEDPKFAELCDRIGVTFIGPSPEAMRKLGDKIGSKLIAEEVGVPVAPWSRGGVDTLEDAQAAAARIGYPLMLKATAGGGGRGIRKVTSDAELAAAYQLTRDEAHRAFGSGVVFLEKLVTGARHVEVQVIADGQGTAWAIGVRDCSVQRRNQKVIEESASVVMTAEQAAVLKESAERLAIAVGYAGAGTVEFLFQPADGTFAFLEVNTRLQVEHPITEVTTDTDLVRLQIQVASGQRLTGDKPVERGHALEARLNAEDPDRDFAPAPGLIAHLEFPTGPGIRVDTGVGEGDSIPADFDSMIAKIIAYGRDRDEALARLRRAMRETTVVIDGGATNKSFVLDLLEQPEVIDGSADTGWIDRVRGEGRLVSEAHSAIALIAAGIEAYEDEEAVERARLLATARGGRPQVQHKVGTPVDLKLRGAIYKVTTFRLGPNLFRAVVETGGQVHTAEVSLTRLGAYAARLELGDRTYRLVTATHGPIHMIEVNGVTHRVSRDEGGVIRAQAPALVVATPVANGDEVAAGAPVLVLESMKMETVIPAPFAARVKNLLVKAGTQVETGAPLATLEPLGDGDDDADNPPVVAAALDLPASRASTEPVVALGWGRTLLDGMLLGYDVEGAAADAALRDYLSARERVVAQGGSPIADEVDLLVTLADFAELSRNRPADEDSHDDTRIHSPREHFHTFLRTLDPDRGALPQQFRDRVSRVLAHYGVSDLDHTPRLESAVFRIFLGQQRSAAETRMATALLQRWIVEPAPAGEVAELARGVLDRLVSATQLRFPIVGDLARSVRFRWFDQPAVDADRSAVLADVGPELAALDSVPEGPERTRRLEALADIPERIVSFLAARLVAGTPRSEPMLSVLIRRHYREHELTGLREYDVDGRAVAAADYSLDRRPTHLITTLGRWDELGVDGPLTRALAAQVEAARTADPTREQVVDLYLYAPELAADPDTAARELATGLARLDFVHGLRRMAIGLVRGAGIEVGYVTLRPQPDGSLAEDRPVRDVHPMVGRRLNLWRLRDFDLTRLEAPHDVLLLHCVGRENPNDQRLVAMAQVRQLAITRDDGGRVTGLPHAERALAQCLEAIRRARGHLATREHRLDMNHVWVHIWPPVDSDLDQLTALQTKLAPLTAGAGIEEVRIEGRIAAGGGRTVPMVARFSYQPGSGVDFTVESPATTKLDPLDSYAEKVVRARRRGVVYPYELHTFIAGDSGTVTEYDLDESGALVPVDRPYGQNTAGIICAVVSTPTPLHPDGVTRVLLCGDPLRSLGSIAEAECARIIAALDLAEELRLPVEWFALSAGARIAMDSGTENMDWIAKALKRIVEFTQDGGEINIVVAGINVGAQPYWNAEATMLMHTKGILVMTPDSAMVLTGKQSLDFSGGVSAEDNFGIGGFDRVMGPNGQAQYWARDFAGALEVLMAHYDATYVIPGEDGPRHAETSDPLDRDVTTYPHHLEGSDFTTVGQIWSPATNPDRKKAFDIRTVMRAVADQDHDLLERWAGMADAETAVVTDARIGGHSVCLIGIESKTVARRGFPPTDGPDTYTAGTLFPRSSKKVARGINAASGNRPLVVLANLSGFDGSPDSMRNLQLEYGAEIGRAIVNFDGPIVFVVISRYHGGAFVVFSKALNPRMTVLALEGSFASVIGGAPAAAVVFSRDVDARAGADPRVTEVEARLARASDAERSVIAAELADVRSTVRAEMVSTVAAEFDGVHNIHRAVAVGSVDEVIAPETLRPRIITALDLG
ncbi:MAG: carboxyl transferase domain-containing protein [Nostocoides sp.]|uniref:ATP-binding protein n=1 Tax=Nostocoides sp. TaxID=1917966 RepID=UPI003C70B0A4